jgi:fructose-1,6-bisphosphatase/inositol monophosphatase family enzyme
VIIEEAGGVIGRVEGGPLTLEPGTVIGANAPAMRDALLSLLQEPG